MTTTTMESGGGLPPQNGHDADTSNLHQLLLEWMDALAPFPAGPPTPSSLPSILSSGTQLCILANAILPDSIPHIHGLDDGQVDAASASSNIAAYLAFCDRLGLSKHFLFSANDLLRGTLPLSVLMQHIDALEIRAGMHIDYTGPRIARKLSHQQPPPSSEQQPNGTTTFFNMHMHHNTHHSASFSSFLSMSGAAMPLARSTSAQAFKVQAGGSGGGPGGPGTGAPGGAGAGGGDFMNPLFFAPNADEQIQTASQPTRPSATAKTKGSSLLSSTHRLSTQNPEGVSPSTSSGSSSAASGQPPSKLHNPVFQRVTQNPSHTLPTSSTTPPSSSSSSPTTTTPQANINSPTVAATSKRPPSEIGGSALTRAAASEDNITIHHHHQDVSTTNGRDRTSRQISARKVEEVHSAPSSPALSATPAAAYISDIYSPDDPEFIQASGRVAYRDMEQALAAGKVLHTRVTALSDRLAAAERARATLEARLQEVSRNASTPTAVAPTTLPSVHSYSTSSFYDVSSRPASGTSNTKGIMSQAPRSPAPRAPIPRLATADDPSGSETSATNAMSLQRSVTPPSPVLTPSGSPSSTPSVLSSSPSSYPTMSLQRSVTPPSPLTTSTSIATGVTKQRSITPPSGYASVQPGAGASLQRSVTPPSQLTTTPTATKSGLASSTSGQLQKLGGSLPNLEEGIIWSEYNGKSGIRGGTIPKLVEKLISDDSAPDYVSAFLFTYRTVMSPKELIAMVVQKHNAIIHDGAESFLGASSSNLGASQSSGFFSLGHSLATGTVSEASLSAALGTSLGGSMRGLDVTGGADPRKKITLRVCNFLRRWVENFFHDFQTDRDLIEAYSTFVESIRSLQDGSLANILERAMTKQLDGGKKSLETTAMFDKKPPTPFLPKPPLTGFYTPEDINPTEMARQLTLIEHDLYRKIPPKEFLGLSWQKADKEEKSPNLLKLIRQFNQVSRWVITALVQENNLRKRVTRLKYFIKVMQELRKLNNFDCMFALMSGLNAAPIHRLKKTWDSSGKLKLFEEIMALNSNAASWKGYRGALHSVDPPCIPYTGVYLSDLVFIEEGNPTYIDADAGIVNVFKMRKVAEVISEIHLYQQQPYNLTPLDAIQSYLLNLEVIDDRLAFKLSLSVEPREG
eukprot:TRINITY_DN1187_c0_g1_i11.p1 TRINITY_DN1187_c0_g1~~TRINITY_DN1187_c0_g1_i11.p1  ORF type:complete len:1140 (-),score=277.83 TRINITY_DN1187_c0_g1_i11:153-3572(-)